MKPVAHQQTLLHISPHPDDEILGAPGTCLSAVQAGWRVVVLPVTLGRAHESDRRRGELVAACRSAALELDLADEPQRSDRLEVATTSDRIRAAILRANPAAVLAPDVSDRHPTHALIATATLAALAESDLPRVLWTYALWGEISNPNLLFRFGPDILDRARRALEHHHSQLDRLPLEALLTSRARLAAITGARNIGMGRDQVDESLPFADLLGEYVVGPDGAPHRTAPRLSHRVAIPTP